MIILKNITPGLIKTLSNNQKGLIRDASFSPIIDTQRRRVSSIIDQSPLSSGDEYIN